MLCRRVRWSSGGFREGRGASRFFSARTTVAANSHAECHSLIFSSNSSLLKSTMPSRNTLYWSNRRATMVASFVPDPFAVLNHKARTYSSLTKGKESELGERHIPSEEKEYHPPVVEKTPGEMNGAFAAIESATVRVVPTSAPAYNSLDTSESIPGDLSDEVYIMGTDGHAFYIAHALAGLETAPPVRLLLSDEVFRQWQDHGEGVNFQIEGKWVRRKHFFAEPLSLHSPEYIEEHIDEPDATMAPMGHIANLIITCPCARTIGLVKKIRHRIDAQTTICLIQEGMGVMEELNESLFPNVEDRPAYVLGHTTHILRRNKAWFSFSEYERGKLSLSAVYRDSEKHPPLRACPPPQLHDGPMHLMRRLVTTHGLWAGGYTYPQLLQRKLPDLVFRSAVAPVALILGMNYHEVLNNPGAVQVVRSLVNEIAEVLAAMPEVQSWEPLQESVQRENLQRDVFLRLYKRGAETTKLAAPLAIGVNTGINNTIGWFAGRGEEVGVTCGASTALLFLVTAKQTANLAAASIPITMQPAYKQWTMPKKNWAGPADSSFR